MHVRPWLQVGYLYDWLLIDRLILHNKTKGYLCVCARATQNSQDAVCMCSPHNGRKVIFYTHYFCRLNPTL